MSPSTPPSPHRRRWTAQTAVLALLLLAGLQLAAAPASPADDPVSRQELDSLRLLQLLDQAPAPPLPPMPIYSEVESASPEFRRLAGRDLETGEVTVRPAAPPPHAPFLRTPPRALQPPSGTAGAEPPVPPVLPEIEGTDGEAARGSCTPPSANLFTHGFPFNTAYKLLMRFSVGGDDYYYVCSAASMGSFHLLTAGHCIFNHDPNDDGDTSDADWADEVWVWAAQTDLVNPFFGAAMDEDRPYSFAKATYLRSYTGWTSAGDFNHDMGYITLDRRDGDHTGWMGREAGVTASSLNFNGYPTQTPYVPAGEIRQYPGFDAGNVSSYTTYRIHMCAYIYGGHSGGPVWRFDGSDRYVQGVNSTSDRNGSATATRITNGKFNDIFDLMATDESVRPPAARPDLGEYFFTTADDRKDLLSNSVPQGGSFDVEYSVLNAGFASSGTITVDFYLSTNPVISTLDTYIGTRTLSSLAAWTFFNPVTSLVANAAPGTYYLGWIMSSATLEYGGDLTCTNDPCSNVAVIADETLTVTAATCSPDGWEPDDDPAQASPIVSGVPQAHSICPIGDEDWASFNLGPAPGGWEVELETSGPGPDDTRMWLYDAGLGQIEFDDDDGNGLFSHIDRVCGLDPLTAGTYYVKVDEFGGNEEIETYSLGLVASPCGAGCSPDFVLSCPTTTDIWSNDGSGSTDLIDSYACNSFNYPAPEYTYVFQPAASTTVTVDLGGLSADLDLLVLHDAGSGCDPVGCIADSTNGGTSPESVSFAATGGETYFVVVDGYEGAVSSYTLTLACDGTGGGAIFSDGFESGNTTAWTTSVP